MSSRVEEGGGVKAPPGDERTSGRPAGGARTSERGAATRSALLAAAEEVFTSVGFAQAGVTEVVARAGASVGSLYHHFSGKADLFLTLYEEFQQRQQDRTRTAVHAARDAGEDDPMRLLLDGARAYLDGCIEERALSRLFLSGDGPPGFDAVVRSRLRDWTDRNAAMFRRAGEPADEAFLVVFSGTMAAATSEVSLNDDEEHARGLADEVLGIIATLSDARRP